MGTETYGRDEKSQLVVAAIVVDDLAVPTRCLVARRLGPAALRGRWEFPGGKVEEGEGIESALMREIREELATSIDIGVELTPPSGSSWPIADRLHMRVWFATLSGGDPRPVDSHDELRWLDAHSLGSVDWLEADRLVLPLLYEQLSH